LRRQASLVDASARANLGGRDDAEHRPTHAHRGAQGAALETLLVRVSALEMQEGQLQRGRRQRKNEKN